MKKKSTANVGLKEVCIIQIWWFLNIFFKSIHFSSLYKLSLSTFVMAGTETERWMRQDASSHKEEGANISECNYKLGTFYSLFHPSNNPMRLTLFISLPLCIRDKELHKELHPANDRAKNLFQDLSVSLCNVLSPQRKVKITVWCSVRWCYVKET